MEIKNGKLIKATAEEASEIKSLYFSSTCKADACKKIIEKYDFLKAYKWAQDRANVASNIILACVYEYQYLKII